MVVQHNISAMTANRYYGINNSTLGKSLEKLSSGYAINRAGDNAAGLAVSEKMRAQIAGLTQASKNAQDGISMVQTFEGALQETDSILQRMRTLAVQSANGSYQDDVDRDAMQLEFDQMNDELNQIADTDFNGVVVLNGGTMADGVKANALGKIDYATKKDDVTNTTRKNLQAKLSSAQQSYNAAKTEFDKNKYDLSSSGDADEWNTVDNHLYTKNAADDLWGNFGFTKGATASAQADTSQADTIAVTFTMQSDGSWKASSAVASKNGEEVKSWSGTTDTALANLTCEKNNAASNAQPANKTGQGGFSVKLSSASVIKKNQDGTNHTASATTSATLGNAVFNAINAKEGDTVTLVYKNSDPNQKASMNIGVNQDSLNSKVYKVDSDGNKSTEEANVSSITFTPMANDSQIDESVARAINAMEDISISITYDQTADFVGSDIKIGDTTLTDTNIGTAAFDHKNVAQIKTDKGDFYAQLSNDKKSIELYAKNNDGAFVSVAKVTPAEDTTTVGTAASGSDPATNAGEAGTLTFKMSASAVSYNPAKTITIDVGDDPTLESSALYTDKLNKADKALAEAANNLAEFNKLDNTKDKDWTRIKEMFSETQSSSGGIVSISDSYDQSKAKLTFADNMSLQVGARTKDVVDFKFSYSSDDLGGLEKNMNCSARADGLNTANLSIKTQQDANDAIDKIDKALNKVSMVRATFGGIQNRLEHKISNIDTNTENLTAAESRIRDTQMDQEMMKFTSAQILSQASQSMLAQANSLPQGVLQLLG